MGEQRYLRAHEAAEYLGVAPAKVRLLPGLPQCRIGQRAIRYDLHDLCDYRPKLPLPSDADGLRRLILRLVGEHETQGFVYFMRCRELVKIGYSIDPPNRHRQLQAFIPFDLDLIGYLPGSILAERALHAVFASIKAGAIDEWFRHSPALLEAIAAIASQEVPNG